MPQWPFGRTRVTWRRGFVYKAEGRAGDESEDAAISLAELLPRPAARFVRELELGAALSYNGRAEADDISLFGLLRDHPPMALRRLVLTCFDSDISWTHVGDLSRANRPPPPRGENVEAGRMTIGRTIARRCAK